MHPNAWCECGLTRYTSMICLSLMVLMNHLKIFNEATLSYLRFGAECYKLLVVSCWLLYLIGDFSLVIGWNWVTLFLFGQQLATCPFSWHVKQERLLKDFLWKFIDFDLSVELGIANGVVWRVCLFLKFINFSLFLLSYLHLQILPYFEKCL